MITGLSSWITTGPDSLAISVKKGMSPRASAARYSSIRGLAHLSKRSIMKIGPGPCAPPAPNVAGPFPPATSPTSALPPQHGPVENAAVVGHGGERERVGADLDAREMVTHGAGLLRGRALAPGQDRIEGLAAAACDHVRHAQWRGEALIVVVVAVEDQSHLVGLEYGDPGGVDARGGAVGSARPRGLVEDDDAEQRPWQAQGAIEP